MTKTQLIARRLQITKELSDMSRNGWKNALPSDYLPLEAELKEILEKLK